MSQEPRAPKTETFVLTAGQTLQINIPGRYLTVRTCTVASFEVGFNNGQLETFYPGGTYPSAVPFDFIRIRDSLGAGCTIELTFADELGLDAAYDSATLTNIKTNTQRLLGTTTPSDLPLTTVGDGTVPANTLLFAASTRKYVEVWADTNNGGLVYVGLTNAVTPTLACRAVLMPGGFWDSYTHQGGVWACGSNATQKVFGGEDL